VTLPTDPTLLDVYLHHVGQSEVPRAFHLWAGLSMVAAAVSDRVWYEKFPGQKLVPNLYVLLLGPSGLGKDQAAGAALRYVADLPVVNVYQGRATAPHLIDRLAGKWARNPSTQAKEYKSKLYLITSELAFSVGRGSYADDFIKLMTALYSGSPYPIHEGTRTHGVGAITNPCINWLGGTTMEWLHECVTRDAIEGGFFARVACIKATYDFTVRYRRPRVPDDLAVCTDFIRAYVKMLTHLRGVFTMTEEAEAIEESWYQTRDVPTDETLLPSWRREHDLVLKLSMLLSLCESATLAIEARHMTEAQQMTRQVLRAVPSVVAHAHVTPETGPTLRVENLLRKYQALPRSTLLKRSRLNAEQMELALKTLMERKQVARTQSPTGASVYVWADRKRFGVVPKGSANGTGPE